MKILIVHVGASTLPIAQQLDRELGNAEIINHRSFTSESIEGIESIIFIGALGICVRSVLPLLVDKHSDPGVVCLDSACRFSIAVAGGHIGGANKLCRIVAHICGATPVVTTQSDGEGLWALDILGREFGWKTEASPEKLNAAIFLFVGGKPTGILLETRDRGTRYLESTLPPHVKIVTSPEEAIAKGCKLLIAVTPNEYATDIPTLFYRPPVLTIGFGCRKGCSADGIPEYVANVLHKHGLSPLSVAKVATVELKRDETAVGRLAASLDAAIDVFTADELNQIKVPNPSDKVMSVVGTGSVSESAAILSGNGGNLLVEKQKCRLSEGNDFTFAVARIFGSAREGHIEIVGAGPGDPELVSVRGKRFLQAADLILYAGSLVPRELTFYAKEWCVVRSSASMTLEEQFALMKEFYDRGLLVVRLHTGDPCIYGAIQEQMAFFDRYSMSYHITPGISSFQAAAAELRSQFTIPERVQSIILTRGEGRTPMPEKEKLHKLAKSQSTMCIYLSAAIADDVQRELLEEYPPETPVAACYKLTWPEQRIYRGKLKDLARIVKENNLTLTTLLVVGDAIDNRSGLSKLYGESFKHLFRP